MCYPAFAIVCGIASFQLMPRIPHASAYLLLVPLICVYWRAPRLRLVVLCGFGFLWAMWRAELIVDVRLDPSHAGLVLTVAGAIASTPVDFGRGTRFDFVVDRVTRQNGALMSLSKLKLSWFGADADLASGSRCNLKVRVKLPYGTRNPGAFDREKWLFTQRVSATGYVVAHRANRCNSASSTHSLRALRARLAYSIRQSVTDTRLSSVIVALAVAEKTGIDDEQWDVLRHTGTSHLLAISGLHISLVAGMAFFAAHWGIGLVVSHHRRWPVQRPAALAAIAAAFAYAALAGFPISTQRALVMLVVAMFYRFNRRSVVSLETYALALAAVAIFDPTALLAASFWLSFIAVGWLLFVTSTRRQAKSWQRVVQLHVFLALGMTPVLGVLHQSVPVASPLANIVAVPVVTLVIVPLVIAGIIAQALAPSVAQELWRLSARIWALLWDYLTLLAEHLGSIALPAAPGGAAVALAVASVALALVPVIRGRILLCTVLIAALFLNHRTPLPRGHLRLTVADVGQGLAVVLETRSKVLVYDTGPAFGRFSAGEGIIAPLLRARGVKQIDTLIVSHGDADHAGGWAGLVAAIPVATTLVSAPSPDRNGGEMCRADLTWIWDGIVFRVLHPGPNRGTGSRNNSSCVLKVEAPGGSVLLPGDIEREVESDLVRTTPRSLAADILLAPHHGSKTSSTGPFVGAVDPKFVVFATGYENRFGLPHPEIVERYRRHGVTALNTAQEGAIEFVLGKAIARPTSFRRSALRYWHQLETDIDTAGRPADSP